MKQEVLECGMVYHIYNRGNNKEDIFIEEKNYGFFLSLMKKYLLPIADIYAYCLMKNHFHLLARIKDTQDIDNKYKEKPYLAFSHLFNAYTKSINKEYNRTGSLFQDRMKRKKIQNEEYLIKTIAYIHLNPIKHEFSESLDYPHSSYNSILSDKPTSLKRAFVLGKFDDRNNFEYWHSKKMLEQLVLQSIVEDDF